MTGQELLDALREADEVLVKVGALDQARAFRNALSVLEAINGASVEFAPDGTRHEPTVARNAKGDLVVACRCGWKASTIFQREAGAQLRHHLSKVGRV